VRLPAHPAARSIITLAGCPLAAPSANRSGSPSPTCAAHVLADLDGRIAAVVDGGPCVVGVESTVLDFSSDPPRLLRPGGIPAELLRELCPELAIDPAVWAPPAADQPARSPGTKYIHYAPRATVIMVKGDAAAYTAYVNAHAAPGTAALCFAGEESGLAVPYITYGCRNNPEEQARLLFSALRSADEIGAKELLAACPEPAGMGLAVYNRLLRAAGFRVVNAECGMRNAELPH
ncbi:MAG: Sua5/YciO/YrdC/YwlC family protein, partial [Oscillospiraceae bacterium]|nr:Sua5/YciO/YrdC/YwlC family protein [Oscillospiraceae bacterium]